jgi:type II secretory pathway component PulF
MGALLGSGLIPLYRSLADSAKSGLPLAKALQILADGRPSIPAETLRDLLRQLELGYPLSRAMKAHPAQFPRWQAEMVAVGEATGRLDTAFLGIAEMLEERRAFALNFLSGMAYPLFIVHIAPFLLNTNLLMTGGFRGYLFAAVRWLLGFYVPVGLAAVLVKKGVVSRRDIPLGPLLSKIEFCAFLSAMLKAAVPHRTALELSASAAGIAAPQNPARNGETMLQCLKPYGVFTPDELARLEVAELSGTLDEDLHRLAVQSREKWQAAIKTVATMLPVFLYLLIATIVGYRIVHFYMDTFSGLPG